jgi:hypothetical protein
MDFNGQSTTEPTSEDLETQIQNLIDDAGGDSVSNSIIKIRFNSSTDALVNNGVGLWEDEFIRIGWDASNMIEFLCRVLPDSGGLQIHGQGTSTDTNTYVT